MGVYVQTGPVPVAEGRRASEAGPAALEGPTCDFALARALRAGGHWRAQEALGGPRRPSEVFGSLGTGPAHGTNVFS